MSIVKYCVIRLQSLDPARLGQFQQRLKTQVILILNFTRPHAITNTKQTLSSFLRPYNRLSD